MKSPKPHSDTGAAATPLQSRRVVLCVTGGIAAYKAAILTPLLVKAGAQVVVVMTEAAQRFVGPLTFETLSGNRVVTSTFERVHDMGAVEHIDLAGWADVVVVQRGPDGRGLRQPGVKSEQTHEHPMAVNGGVPVEATIEGRVQVVGTPDLARVVHDVVQLVGVLLLDTSQSQLRIV